MAQNKIQVKDKEQPSIMQIKNLSAPHLANGHQLQNIAERKLLLQDGIKNGTLKSIPRERNTFSQKLKKLMEKSDQNHVRIVHDNDPYTFSEIESVQFTSNSTATNQSGPAAKVPKLLASANGVQKPGGNDPPLQPIQRVRTIAAKQPFSILGAVLQSDRSEPALAIRDRIPFHKPIEDFVKTAGKDKPYNHGKSQMSRLAMAKIEKSIVGQKKIVQSCLTVAPKTAIQPRQIPQKETVEAGIPSETKVIPIEANSVATKIDADVKKTTYETARQQMWQLRNRFHRVKGNHGSLGLDARQCTDEGEGGPLNIYQDHWFSLCHDYNSFTGNNRKRDAKLAQVKTELRHKLMQYRWKHRDDYRGEMSRLIISCAKKKPNVAALLIDTERSNRTKASYNWLSSVAAPEVRCTVGESGDVCEERSLPGVQACPQHIPFHTSQVLFSRCITSGCKSPALGKHPSALCNRHLSVTSQIQDARVSSSATVIPVPAVRRHRPSNSSSRSKKRRRQPPVKDTSEYSMKEIGYVAPKDSPPSNYATSDVTSVHSAIINQNTHVTEELASGELPIDSAVLANLDHHALDEADLTLLSHISPETFNELFTEKYETDNEELERALEAVNNDVESLKLLNLLDDECIAETLAALPELVKFPHGPGAFEQNLCEGPSLQPLPCPPHADVLQS